MDLERMLKTLLDPKDRLLLNYCDGSWTGAAWRDGRRLNAWGEEESYPDIAALLARVIMALTNSRDSLHRDNEEAPGG